MDSQYVGRAATDNHAKVFDSRGVDGKGHVIQEIKNRAAMLLAEIDGINIPPGNSEAGRLVSLAKTSLEESVMWAVKAVSRT